MRDLEGNAPWHSPGPSCTSCAGHPEPGAAPRSAIRPAVSNGGTGRPEHPFRLRKTWNQVPHGHLRGGPDPRSAGALPSPEPGAQQEANPGSPGRSRKGRPPECRLRLPIGPSWPRRFSIRPGFRPGRLLAPVPGISASRNAPLPISYSSQGKAVRYPGVLPARKVSHDP